MKKIDGNLKYAVFFDIDGTLLGSSDAALCENIRTVNSVRAMGHKVFVATGRAMSFIPDFIKNGSDFDGIVSGAGASVYIGGKNIFRKLLPYDLVIKACEYLERSGVRGALEGEDLSYFFGDMSFADENWVRLTAENLGVNIKPDTEIVKLTVDGRVPDELMEVMGSEFSVIQHSQYGEVIYTGYDKAFGVRCALESLGLPREQSIAVGDSLNDLPMIEYAGIGVAMGNAIDEVKEKADFVTDSVDNAGAAKILKKLFKI